MADFATYNDRRSAMRRVLTPLPEPDGVLDQADAQHVRWQYRGLLVEISEPADLIRSARAALVRRVGPRATLEKIGT